MERKNHRDKKIKVYLVFKNKLDFDFLCISPSLR